MGRKKKTIDRGHAPDPKYNSVLLTKFVCRMMWQGKKSVNMRIMYDAMEAMQKKANTPALEIFQALGHEVYTVGLEGITPKEIEGCSAKVAYFRLGQVSGPIEFLKKSGVTKVLMAGKVQHVSIFCGFVPDLRAARLLLKMKDRKPAAILGAIADELAEEGLEVISSATSARSSSNSNF